MDFKIRYYCVGEYGPNGSKRPHYHLALFGFPCCVAPPPAHTPRVNVCQCEPCKIIATAWGLGFSDVRKLEIKSAQYICDYVTQRKTKKGLKRDKDRTPEFATMSLKPGIGANAMQVVNNTLTTDFGSRELLLNGDVPFALQHGRKKWPLDRYLRVKLREFYGFPERKSLRGTKNNTPDGVLLRKSQELLTLQECYEADPQNKERPFAQFKRETRKQEILNFESKQRIFNKKGEL